MEFSDRNGFWNIDKMWADENIARELSVLLSFLKRILNYEVVGIISAIKVETRNLSERP